MSLNSLYGSFKPAVEDPEKIKVNFFKTIYEGLIVKFKEKTYKEIIELNDVYSFETSDKGENVLVISSVNSKSLVYNLANTSYSLILKDPRCTFNIEFLSGTIFKLKDLEFTLAIKTGSERRISTGNNFQNETYFEVTLI